MNKINSEIIRNVSSKISMMKLAIFLLSFFFCLTLNFKLNWMSFLEVDKARHRLRRMSPNER